MHFIWPAPEWRQAGTFHERGNPRSLRQKRTLVRRRAYLSIRLSIASISIPVIEISGKAASISRTQVGLVTLISVRRSPMISRPTKIRPLAFSVRRRGGRFPSRFRSTGGLRRGRRRPDCRGSRHPAEFAPGSKARALHPLPTRACRHL